MRGLKFNSYKRSMADLGEGLGGPVVPFILVEKHIKLFPQRDEHLFFSVPGVRDH